MRIGELAERTGVPSKTLRFWESIGVLAEPPRDASGYRVYDDLAIGRIEFVRAAQTLGLSLGEIREILAVRDHGEVPCRHVATLLERHRARVEQQIAGLVMLRDELEMVLGRAASLRPEDCPEREVCHLVVARAVPTTEVDTAQSATTS
ncbi:transcriptional regulator, MerR family [Acidimicrobium ferrooxidans DSM 10331]|uniref:Transcriptional regulator, MerR family n=1 Tax=Acidimicrobium ferrooxidans (strain DSM 10331 / JCM 15462 / NBRC 103882 / ICP) TaxID=525909 RepID=C7M2C1_ACIFD|nr:heavy metal-responsive transcriptional regulator [Acidimicrobium ferrooxidans]ACU54910.1 transcriptional regulator, MerR family [Acidimicrobium ferrooxidans DSM 10331]